MMETAVEAALKKKAEARGGKCYKLTSVRGIPDRIILLPVGKFAFVETKTDNGRISKIQMVTQKRLRDMGFLVFVVWKTCEIESVLDEIQTA